METKSKRSKIYQKLGLGCWCLLDLDGSKGWEEVKASKSLALALEGHGRGNINLGEAIGERLSRGREKLENSAFIIHQPKIKK